MRVLLLRNDTTFETAYLIQSLTMEYIGEYLVIKAFVSGMKIGKDYTLRGRIIPSIIAVAPTLDRFKLSTGIRCWSAP